MLLGSKKNPALFSSKFVRKVLVPITRDMRNKKRPQRQEQIKLDKDPIHRSYSKINGDDGIDWSKVRG